MPGFRSRPRREGHPRLAPGLLRSGQDSERHEGRQTTRGTWDQPLSRPGLALFAGQWPPPCTIEGTVLMGCTAPALLYPLRVPRQLHTEGQ